MSPKLKLWAKRLKGPKGNAFRLRQAEELGRAAYRDVASKRKLAA